MTFSLPVQKGEKMPKSTTKRRAPKYRTLTIEVEESIAARLAALAGTRARYPEAGAVAAEVVTLYLGLLEELETDMATFVERQKRRVLRRGSVAVTRR
jgi:hypothetical protein